jgi:glycerol-3-phosphate dehydrogenase (NAD(P)+)
MNWAVLGAGGWGTAVARLLARTGLEVILWARDPSRADAIRRGGRNEKYLPGVSLPPSLEVTSDLSACLAQDVLVLAVPSIGMPSLLNQLAACNRVPNVMINLAKGIDLSSQQTMSELISGWFPDTTVFTLSGPSHAEEVGRDMPTAVVLAGSDLVLGSVLQREISTPRFRVYLSTDLRGVELCSAVKNVIALATGISDGLGYGDNSRGALITRGLAEMVRLGKALGVQETTFFGLSGLGDLVATCTSPHSRNRAVGVRLGQGEPLGEILRSQSTVAEGVYAAGIVWKIACEHGIDMPITLAVHRLLQGEEDPLTLVDQIMTRSPKREGG